LAVHSIKSKSASELDVANTVETFAYQKSTQANVLSPIVFTAVHVYIGYR